MNDFLRAQFDKLLVAALICFMLGVLVHLIHVHTEPAAQAIAWLEKSIDILTGGLIGIVTGRVISGGGTER